VEFGHGGDDARAGRGLMPSEEACGVDATVPIRRIVLHGPQPRVGEPLLGFGSRLLVDAHAPSSHSENSMPRMPVLGFRRSPAHARLGVPAVPRASSPSAVLVVPVASIPVVAVGLALPEPHAPLLTTRAPRRIPSESAGDTSAGWSIRRAMRPRSSARTASNQ